MSSPSDPRPRLIASPVRSGDQGGDGPEHPQGDGLRLARPFDLSFGHRGDVEGVDAASREELDDLSLHGGDVGVAVSEPEAVRRVREARVQADL